MAITPYADETYADAYFAELLGTAVWDAASSADQTKALKTATLQIDTLNFIGHKTDPAQVREFPRNDDTAIPDEVKQACCEQALALLKGETLEKAFNDRRLASKSVGDASESYRDGIDTFGENGGLTSVQAGRLLMPWIQDPTEIQLERTS